MKTRMEKVVLSVFRLVILLAIFTFTFIQTTRVQAHHLAPVDNNVTTGNVNEEMVHNGFDVGGMEDMPTIGGGNLNRSVDPWMP